MNENTSKLNKDFVRNEIDYKIILERIWTRKRIILYAVAIGAILGILIAFISPKEYKVVTTMLPQSDSESGLGKISSLAAIAGFDLNLGISSTEITPIVYPQIMESETFLAKIMYSKYNFEKVSEPVNIYDYYKKVKKNGIFDVVTQYTIGLPGLLKKTLKGNVSVKEKQDKLPLFTKDEEEILLFLKSNLTLMVNKKEGYLTLTCIMPEPTLAAQVADNAQKLLQETITEYKTKSAREQLDFIEQRYNEKKVEYQKLQNRLANFKDRNQNMSTAAANAEIDRLQGEYDISFAVYSELAKSLEQAKIQVKRQTPVFAIIKPVIIPNDKFKPKRTTTIILWTLIGFIIGMGIVFGIEYYSDYKSKKQIKID